MAFSAQGFVHARADIASFFEDDAFYYIIIARNLAEHRASTFDGISQTNGYHPLWLLVITALNFIQLPGLIWIHLLQLSFDACSLALLIQIIRPSNFKSILFVATAFFFAMFSVAGRGMEADILILTFCLFISRLYTASPGRWTHNVQIGIAGALCMSARIDAAAFVLPMLLVGCPGPRDALWRGLVPGLAGVAYLWFNLWLFALPLPVSGYVKSLGGFHFNTALFDQFRLMIPDDLNPIGTFRSLITGRFFWLLWILPLAIYAAYISEKITRQILGAFSVGLTIYVLKLFFFSSWQIWIWYQYPITFGFICLLFFLKNSDPLSRPTRSALPVAAAFALATALTIQSSLATVRSGLHVAGPVGGFYAVNRLAAAEFGPILKGTRIAMGDRSGSMSYLYGGGLLQLEGLTGDRAYLDALRAGGDIANYLCQRDVRYILAYQPDLGTYDSLDIPVIRQLLSDYGNSPVLRVYAKDEIGRVSDLSLFDARVRGEEGDSFLYGWRLSACSGKLDR